METGEIKSKESLSFWALLSSGIISLALLILIFHSLPKLWLFPTFLLIGLPLCWKWGKYGALSIIGLFSVFFVLGYTSETSLWDLAFAASLALVLLIVSISFEELDAASVISTGKIQRQNEQLSLAKSLLMQVQNQLASHQYDSSLALNELSQKLQNQEIETGAWEKKHREVISELEQAKQQNKHLESTYASLRKELLSSSEKHQQNCRAFEEQRSTFEEHQKLAQHKAQELYHEKESLKALVEASQNKEAALRIEIEKLAKEMQHSSTNSETSAKDIAEKPDFSNPSPQKLLYQWQAWKRSQGMYQQLRHQFDEKSAELHQARKDLFHAQEEILALQNKLKEEQLYHANHVELSMQKYVVQMENNLSAKEIEHHLIEDSLHSLIASLMDQLKKRTS